MDSFVDVGPRCRSKAKVLLGSPCSAPVVSAAQTDLNDFYTKLKCTLLSMRRVSFRVIKQSARVQKMAKKSLHIRHCLHCLTLGIVNIAGGGLEPRSVMLTMPGFRQCAQCLIRQLFFAIL
ncbi:hypothetical protein M0804_004091 [Polistes exclamans]|nr:hypothetical protein M0804_004091 [Polistes exclamans]